MTRKPLNELCVERSEAPSDIEAFEEQLRGIDSRPGMYYGCAYECQPVYRRRSVVFSDPALRITLDDGVTRMEPLSDTGRSIARVWASQHQGAWDGDRFIPVSSRSESIHPFLDLLRAFGASFTGQLRSFGLYGVWNFDHWRLRHPDVQASRDARVALYLPLSLLHRDGDHVTSVRFALPNLKPVASESRSRRRDAPTAPLRSFPARLRDDFEPAQYAARLNEAIDRASHGDLASVTLTQAFRRPFEGLPSDAFARLRRRYPMPEMYFVNIDDGEHLMGASPDLQAHVNEGIAVCAPVCGTSHRGHDAVDDAVLGIELLSSSKEAAALALCTDSFASRMASFCEPGSVVLRSRQRLHYFSPVIHAADCLDGKLARDRDVWDVLLATAAPPTVTGVPEQLALNTLAALEGSPRGWFGGAVGYMGFDEEMRVGTVMRMVWLRGGVAEVRAGGVVTAMSTVEGEGAESRVKALSLMEMVGLVDVRPVASDVSAPQSSNGGGSSAVLPLLEFFGSDEDTDQSLLAYLKRYAGKVRLGGDPADVRGVAVVAGAAAAKSVIDRLPAGIPLLLIGGAAVEWLIQRGVRASILPNPRDGHLACSSDDSLPGWSAHTVMQCGTLGVDVAAVPGTMQVLMKGGDGRLLAFASVESRVVGLNFLPQSVLCSAGPELLRRALALCSNVRHNEAKHVGLDCGNS